MAPGDLYNKECPHKACCSEWGFCGLTKEFCDTKKSKTGAPGTTGCYSNCGYGTLPTKKASSFRKMTFWLDDGSTPPSNYDTVIYSFADINPDMTISVGKGFEKFKSLNTEKLISFGGWDFSTSSGTYGRFRDAVSDGKREQFGNNLVDFMNKHGLDGFNMDWEYPEAPDIPGIPAGNKSSHLVLCQSRSRLVESIFFVTHQRI